MEKFTDELLAINKFSVRVMRLSIHALCVFLAGVLPGLMGFMFFEGHSASDALLNAISMAGAQSVHYPANTIAGKYFTAIYGFFLQGIFIVSFGLIISPFVHRLLHKWHINDDE